MSYDDASMAQMALNPRSGDDKLYVEFQIHPLHNDNKSAEAGRPIYDDVEFVKILTPGQRDVYFQPATDQDRMRFRKQYENFKAGNADAISGTPLALLPGASQSMVEEFAYFKVRTIEQLADLNDAVAARFPGAHEWKRKAKAFVAAAQENAPVAKVQAELEQRDAEIAALKAQLNELAAAVAKSGKTK